MTAHPNKPKTKTKLLKWFGGVVVLFAIVFAVSHDWNGEPVYQGKKLGAWVDELVSPKAEEQDAAADAIRQIGPKALPYLVEWIKPLPKPSKLQRRINGWLAEVPIGSLRLPEPPHRRGMAMRAFKVLGPVATPAIGDLEKRLGDPGWLVAESLAGIGTNSLPALNRALASQQETVRLNALIALGELGQRAQPLLPEIVTLTHDTNSSIARSATMVLGEMGGAAKSFVPEFEERLTSSKVDTGAAYALGRMGYAQQLLQLLTNQPIEVQCSCVAALDASLNYQLYSNTWRDTRFLNVSQFYLLTSVPSPGQAMLARTFFGDIMVPMLTNYLHGADPVCRAQAADDLGAFGVKGFIAISALSIALSDQDETVRLSAQAALNKIDVQLYDGGIIRGPRSEKRIALEFTGHTFAEGGDTILDELAKHHAKASFFLTGDFLRNPEFKALIERIVRDGHYLGPHSDKHVQYCAWDEPRNPLVSQDDFDNDLMNNIQALRPFRRRGPRGGGARFWLPAYEWYNQDIVNWSKALRFTLVNFTPGTRSNADYTQESDTTFVSSQTIFDSIVKKEREDPDGLNGFLLLMHLGAGPGRKDKMHEHFGELLDYLGKRGYEFVRIDELLEPK